MAGNPCRDRARGQLLPGPDAACGADRPQRRLRHADARGDDRPREARWSSRHEAGLRSAFIETANGGSLDKVVALVGVSRIPAGSPVAKLRFSRARGLRADHRSHRDPVTDHAGNRYLTLTSVTLEPGERAAKSRRSAIPPRRPIARGTAQPPRSPHRRRRGHKPAAGPPAHRAETDEELRRRARGALQACAAPTMPSASA